ncbi:MAG: tyrosine recombinase XerC [Ruminococcaceae bacterium]|nr:tyrosine recombinase XerC [Oscillospiraceae bacterium]
MKREILISSPEVIHQFLLYNEAIKNKSSATIDEYFRDLQTFFRYIKTIKGRVDTTVEFNQIEINDVDIDLIKTINVNDLYSFLVYCKDERSNNSTTRARKVSTLRQFFKYLSVQTHQIDENPAELLDAPKLKKSLPKHLSLEDSLKLLNSVKEGNNPNSIRDYCIITLFLNCGMRLSELCSLNVTDIKADGSLRILGKGNKERVIYLNEACRASLLDYLKIRPMEGIPADHKNALFISRNRRRISNKTVQHIVYTNLEKIGLGDQGLSVHKLRHTAATLMYQHGGVDIRVLQDILGHENLGTTQIYTHVADSQVKNAIDSNPLSSINKK